MTLKTYCVTLVSDGGATRDVRVPSPTDVQAGDAARPLMSQGERILSISEVKGDGQPLDAAPPLSQAAELASETSGMAAAPQPGAREGDAHG